MMLLEDQETSLDSIPDLHAALALQSDEAYYRYTVFIRDIFSFNDISHFFLMHSFRTPTHRRVRRVNRSFYRSPLITCMVPHIPRTQATGRRWNRALSKGIQENELVSTCRKGKKGPASVMQQPVGKESISMRRLCMPLWASNDLYSWTLRYFIST